MEPLAGMLMLAAGFLVVVMIVLLFLLIVHYAFFVAAYILEGIALSAIARRRGIAKPWLAWVPVGKFWLLGAISDQYRYVVHGQVRNRRHLLLWSSLAFTIGTWIFQGWLNAWSAGTVYSAFVQGDFAFASTELWGIGVLCLTVAVYLAAAVAVAVFQYMAYYDLFCSSQPKRKLLYLLLSIFTVYPLPFFVFSCRNQDLGMPPRTDQPASSPD